MEDYTQLLQQIANNTAHSDSMWVAIIAGGAGVFGACIPALLNYFASNRAQEMEEKRLRAGIVTAERLRWLQDVRQRLARFYVQLDMQYNFLSRPVPQTPEAKIEYQKQFDEFSNEVNEQCNIITLMMNPEKPEQNSLKLALQKALVFITECITRRNLIVSASASLVLPVSPAAIQFDRDEYTKIKIEAFDSLTQIGITTWERIKGLN